jgi:hypothetical protein
MPDAIFKAIDNGNQAPKLYQKDSVRPYLHVHLPQYRSLDPSGRLLKELFELGIPVMGSETLVEPVNSGCLSLS